MDLKAKINHSTKSVINTHRSKSATSCKGGKRKQHHVKMYIYIRVEENVVIEDSSKTGHTGTVDVEICEQCLFLSHVS
jgi:hypothetical protein